MAEMDGGAGRYPADPVEATDGPASSHGHRRSGSVVVLVGLWVMAGIVTAVLIPSALSRSGRRQRRRGLPDLPAQRPPGGRRSQPLST